MEKLNTNEQPTIKGYLDSALVALKSKDLIMIENISSQLNEMVINRDTTDIADEDYDIISVNEWVGFVKEYLEGKDTGYSLDGIMHYYNKWFS